MVDNIQLKQIQTNKSKICDSFLRGRNLIVVNLFTRRNIAVRIILTQIVAKYFWHIISFNQLKLVNEFCVYIL